MGWNDPEHPRDPERHWNPEPAVSFESPRDHPANLYRDFFLSHGVVVKEENLRFLANLNVNILTFIRGRPENRYRDISRTMLEILKWLDTAMTDSEDPLHVWAEIAEAFVLPSWRYRILRRRKKFKELKGTFMDVVDASKRALDRL